MYRAARESVALGSASLRCLREKEVAVFKHGSDKNRTCLECHSRYIFL
jgi:hypothetical protein